MLLFSLQNERTYGRLQTVLEHFSMTPAGRLTVFTNGRQRRCSIYPNTNRRRRKRRTCWSSGSKCPTLIGFTLPSQRVGERSRFLGHVLDIQLKPEAQDVLCAAAFRVHAIGRVAVADFGGLDCSHYSN